MPAIHVWWLRTGYSKLNLHSAISGQNMVIIGDLY